MERERARSIISNLYEIKERFDELTSSILEYCVENNTTNSYSNLVTFVTKLENTKYIISKFRIIDIIQIIAIEDISDYRDFLISSYMNFFTELFSKVKFLIKYTNCKDVWYEVIDEEPTHIDTKRTVLKGPLGMLSNIHLYSMGIVVDPLTDIQEKVRAEKEKITKIVIENDRKRFYVEKI